MTIAKIIKGSGSLSMNTDLVPEYPPFTYGSGQHLAQGEYYWYAYSGAGNPWDNRYTGVTNIDFSDFYSTAQLPFVKITRGTYTLNSGSVLGQPSNWLTGHVVSGFCDYGYDGSGGVFIGSMSTNYGGSGGYDSPGKWYMAYGGVGGATYFILRQCLYNASVGEIMVRVGGTTRNIADGYFGSGIAWPTTTSTAAIVTYGSGVSDGLSAPYNTLRYIGTATSYTAFNSSTYRLTVTD